MVKAHVLVPRNQELRAVSPQSELFSTRCSANSDIHSAGSINRSSGGIQRAQALAYQAQTSLIASKTQALVSE